MTEKIAYMRFLGAIDDGERSRIQASDLYQRGDTIAVWVNEGDICILGECVDTPPARFKARQVIARLCDDPKMWATHGAPPEHKLKRLEDELAAAFATNETEKR